MEVDSDDDEVTCVRMLLGGGRGNRRKARDIRDLNGRRTCREVVYDTCREVARVDDG
jgi:hypothetical protein